RVARPELPVHVRARAVERAVLGDDAAVARAARRARHREAHRRPDVTIVRVAERELALVVRSPREERSVLGSRERVVPAGCDRRGAPRRPERDAARALAALALVARAGVRTAVGPRVAAGVG